MVDGDTYLHVAAGRWMLQHHQFIRADPFSFTYFGQPWSDPEWLSELLMAMAYRLDAWSGVALLFAVALGLTSFLLARRLLRHLGPLAVLVILELAVLCIATGQSSRPYVLALPVLVLWTNGLVQARAEKRAPSPWLLVLMTVWSNLHGSFLFGLALIAPFAAESFFEEKDNGWRRARGWLAFAAASILAAAINPHGYEGLIAPVRFMLRPAMALQMDWQSASFSQIGPFEISLLALIAVGLVGKIRVPIFRLLTLLALVHMALSGRRYSDVFAVVAPLILAAPLAAFAPRVRDTPARFVSITEFAPALALLAGLGISAARLAVPNDVTNQMVSPASALAHVPPEISSQHVFNEDVLGGFLLFNGIKPFIDGRDEMYSDAFLVNYSTMTSPDRAAILRQFARYDIAWTILLPSDPANSVLDLLPGWRVLFANRLAIVHVRSGAPSALVR